MRHEGRGKVLTRTLAIRQERAAACTQWSVNENMVLRDGSGRGLLPGMAAREHKPRQLRQVLSQVETVERFQPPPHPHQAMEKDPQGQTRLKAQLASGRAFSMHLSPGKGKVESDG